MVISQFAEFNSPPCFFFGMFPPQTLNAFCARWMVIENDDLAIFFQYTAEK